VNSGQLFVSAEDGVPVHISLKVEGDEECKWQRQRKLERFQDQGVQRFIHAWTLDKAVEYLRKAKEMINNEYC
jgi:hypothetical protein